MQQIIEHETDLLTLQFQCWRRYQPNCYLYLTTFFVLCMEMIKIIFAQAIIVGGNKIRKHK